jgi:hypothetical protein
MSEFEQFITDVQDACDHYLRFYKADNLPEPRAFVEWLPRELRRRNELRALLAKKAQP